MDGAMGTAQGGFTLMELVLVVVILGVLGAVAAPRFFGTTDFDQRFAVDETLAALRYAQKRAVAGRCEVWVSTGAGGVSLATRTNATNCGTTSTDYGATVVLPADAEALRDLPAALFDGDTVTFDALGRALEGDTTVSVGSRGITVVGETGFAYAG